MHPKYVTDKAYFDVGIAIAESPIQFNEYIRPICLPVRPVDDADYLEGDLVTLAGWGLYYNIKNEVQIGSLLKLINLRVSFWTELHHLDLTISLSLGPVHMCLIF